MRDKLGREDRKNNPYSSPVRPMRRFPRLKKEPKPSISLKFHVDFPGDSAAGLRGFTETVTLNFQDTPSNLNNDGDEEMIHYFAEMIGDWFEQKAIFHSSDKDCKFCNRS